MGDIIAYIVVFIVLFWVYKVMKSGWDEADKPKLVNMRTKLMVGSSLKVTLVAINRTIMTARQNTGLSMWMQTA